MLALKILPLPLHPRKKSLVEDSAVRYFEKLNNCSGKLSPRIKLPQFLTQNNYFLNQKITVVYQGNDGMRCKYFHFKFYIRQRSTVCYIMIHGYERLYKVQCIILVSIVRKLEINVKFTKSNVKVLLLQGKNRHNLGKTLL